MSGKGVAMSDESLVKQGVAAATSMVAAIVLLTIGILHVLSGVSALMKDDLVVAGPEYIYQFDTTAWGWIHLVLGVIVAAVGVMLFTGATWARVGAMVICALSLLANFLWLPHYPWWSVVMIVLDVFVIWAVATWKPGYEERL
ncbi:integral membrane protein [Rhodococcus opacus]|uniref:Integral membrane protein n=2 Tax=Rhodococcus opacus TaxID=37919 RepID=A0A1B1JWX3_RHOOP|nr:integral membrane protein [Rhodococcus opacus]